MKNKRTKRLKLVGLFMALLLLQAIAKAGYYLPESSLWQGARYYNENSVYAYVEYAVYDTASANYHNTLDGLIDGFINPGSGQYIYAYQASNLGTGLLPIAMFELLGGNPSLADGIGSQDDGFGGLIPTNNGASFIWTFTNGLFVVNEHSAFMVFSSDLGPIAGSFRLSTEYGDEPPFNGSQTDVPEPATVALLTVGVYLTRRKKLYKRNVHKISGPPA